MKKILENESVRLRLVGLIQSLAQKTQSRLYEKMTSSAEARTRPRDTQWEEISRKGKRAE